MPADYLDPSPEAFALAEVACLAPDVLMMSVPLSDAIDGDLPALPEGQVRKSLEEAVSLAEEAASLDPIWRDLAHSLAFLGFYYAEVVAAGDYDLSPEMAREIDDMLTFSCGMVGWEWSSVDAFLFFVGIPGAERPSLSGFP